MPPFLTHPYLLLALTALFWGGNAVAGKLAVGHISPMMLTLLRWTFACLFMFPFAIRDVKREWPMIRVNLPILFALGAGGFTVFNATFYTALNYTTAINVTIEQSAMPLLVFLANFILFHTRVHWLQITGFLLTLLGVALTATHGNLGGLLRLELNRGDAIMLFAVFVYGVYTVCLRYKPDLSWKPTIFCLSVAAFITSVPFAIWESASGNLIMPGWEGMTAALYTAIFPSLVAQSTYIAGVQMIGPNRANLFINLVPIFGSILAVLIIGEVMHGYHVASLIAVMGGILLAEKGAKRRPAPMP